MSFGIKLDLEYVQPETLSDWIQTNCRSKVEVWMVHEFTGHGHLYGSFSDDIFSWPDPNFAYVIQNACEHFSADYHLDAEFRFDDLDEAVLFKLTWGGTNAKSLYIPS